MKSYEEFIGQLRASVPKLDYNQMQQGIVQRKAQRSVFLPIQISLMLSSSLAIVFISLALYLNFAKSSNDLVLNYVMEQEQINGNVIMSYVFDD